MQQMFWSKSLFGNKLTIVRGEELVGNIVWDNFFSARAQATFNGRRFTLNREFFLSKLEIYEAGNQILLGSIMVNLFNPRSDVVINGKRFELEIKNFWQSRWSWKFNGAEIITYQSNELLTREKGEIHLFTTCSEEVEVLLLMGLFVRNQLLLFMIFLLFLFFIVIF